MRRSISWDLTARLSDSKASMRLEYPSSSSASDPSRSASCSERICFAVATRASRLSLSEEDMSLSLSISSVLPSISAATMRLSTSAISLPMSEICAVMPSRPMGVIFGAARPASFSASSASTTSKAPALWTVAFMLREMSGISIPDATKDSSISLLRAFIVAISCCMSAMSSAFFRASVGSAGIMASKVFMADVSLLTSLSMNLSSLSYLLVGIL